MIELGDGMEQWDNPSWLRIEQLSSQETDAGKSLYQYRLSPDFSGSTDGIERVTVHRFAPYDSPELRLWSDQEITDWQALTEEEDVYFVFCLGGYASDFSQWNRNGCSWVNTLYDTWDREKGHGPDWMDPERPDFTRKSEQDKRIVALIMDCPGFDGSLLVKEKTGKVLPADVGRQAYADLLRGYVEALRIPEARTIPVSHSAGATALVEYLTQYPSRMKGVLCNPAINTGRQVQFEALRVLNSLKALLVHPRLKEKATEVVVQVIGGGLNVLKVRDELAQAVAQARQPRIALGYLGRALATVKQKLSPAGREQRQMHVEQIAKHPGPNEAKLAELVEPTPVAVEAFLSFPTLIVGSHDLTTPFRPAAKWLERFRQLVQAQLDAQGIQVSPDGGETQGYLARFLHHVVQPRELPTTHDGIMVDAATQQFTCTEAVKQLRRQIRLNEGDFKQPIEAVQETRKRGWQLALDIDEDYKPELSSHGEVAAAKLGFRVGPENAVAAVARAEQALPESFRERMEQTEVYLSWLDVLDLLETLPDYQEGEAIPPQIYDRFKAILVLPAVVAGAVDAENPDWMSQYVEVVQTGDKYTHRGAQLSAWFSDQRSSDDCFRFKRGLIAVEEALRNGIADEWYSKARRWFRETHMRRFAAVLKMQQMSDVFGFYHLVETGEVAFLNDFIEKRGLTEKELTDLRDFMAEDLGAGFKLFRMYPKLYRVPIDLNDLQTLLETALLPKPESA